MNYWYMIPAYCNPSILSQILLEYKKFLFSIIFLKTQKKKKKTCISSPVAKF